MRQLTMYVLLMSSTSLIQDKNTHVLIGAGKTPERSSRREPSGSPQSLVFWSADGWEDEKGEAQQMIRARPTNGSDRTVTEGFSEGIARTPRREKVQQSQGARMVGVTGIEPVTPTMST